VDTALALHRFHFAFTITFHYLFVQLTLGLGFLIFILRTMALRTGDEHYNDCARFWARIFAVNFALGVVTGIPMEFQFGTNWSRFARDAGGVIGQPLGMEGLYSFFLESTFLGLMLFGEKLLGRVGHWAATGLVWIGSWMSGYLIVATDAWMQRPIGYSIDKAGRIQLASWADLLFNRWAFWQFWHAIMGGIVTASFAVAGIGAVYLLLKQNEKYAQTFIRTGVIAGFFAAILVAFPTGDQQGRLVAVHQPISLAAMEGHFHTGPAAPIYIMGQPDIESQRMDNPFLVPGVLSFIVHGRWDTAVKGLADYPRDQWPDQIPLLFFSFHIMVGLGTLFVLVMGLSTLQLLRGKLFQTKLLLWSLLLFMPLPYVANTAGWMTAELGRQPWLIYGLMRTVSGISPHVSSGNTMFTLLGFMGLYSLLFVLGLFSIWRSLEQGPGHVPESEGTPGEGY
jgi:cytochrome d ubiquinol oxidase subunit I